MWARRVRAPCEAGWWPVSLPWLAWVCVLVAGATLGQRRAQRLSPRNRCSAPGQIRLPAVLGHTLGTQLCDYMLPRTQGPAEDGRQVSPGMFGFSRAIVVPGGQGMWTRQEQ